MRNAMKNAMTVMLLALAVIMPASALTNRIRTPMGFKVQGGYSEFATIHIRPISADSIQYTQGMPFDLLGSDVNPNGPDSFGRRIANWELITNQPKYDLNVYAYPMKHVDADTHPGDPRYNRELNYRLTFKYSLSYFGKDSSSTPVSTNPVTFFVNSKSADGVDPTPKNPIKNSTEISPDAIVGSSNGEIYFKFDVPSYEALHDDTLTAPGYYTAKVVMELTSK